MGFQYTGAHFLNFDAIQLEPGERPEDLFQRLTSFIEDNLLQHGSGNSHNGEIPEAEDVLSPSLENLSALNTGPTIPCKTKIWARPSSQNTGQLKARKCLTV